MTSTSISKTVAAPIERVWDVFTDVENAAAMSSGIESVEVLSDVPFGIGYRWRETRRMFGQSATEEMWVSALERARFYEVAAASHGTRYLSRYDFVEVPGGTNVSLTFEANPESMFARTMGLTLGWAFKGSMTKQLRKDLDEIAAVCESG